MYVSTYYVCIIQYISQNYNKLRVFQSQRAFHSSILKTVHFKMIIISIYRNPNSHIQILLDNS
jgi:hypothetical protein